MTENSKKISDLLTRIKAFGIQPGKEQALINAVEAARTLYLASRKRALDLLSNDHKSAQARETILRETIERREIMAVPGGHVGFENGLP